MRPALRTLAAALFSACAASPLLAATFTLELTQTGLGDAGPDWFGTVSVPDAAANGLVSGISLAVNGISYDVPSSGAWQLYFRTAGSFGPEAFLLGTLLSTAISDTPAPAIWFDAFGQSENNGPIVYTYRWSSFSCSTHVCSNTFAAGGTAQLIEQTDPPVVPLPAAGGLLATALGASWALRRRR